MKLCLTCFNEFTQREDASNDWEEHYCSWLCYTESTIFKRAQASMETLEENLPEVYCRDLRTVLQTDEFSARFRGWLECVVRGTEAPSRKIPSITLFRMIDAQAQLIDALGRRVRMLEDLRKDRPNE